MRMRRPVVITLVVATAVGCWNDRDRATVASEGAEPARTEVVEPAPEGPGAPGLAGAERLAEPAAVEPPPPVSPEAMPVVAAFERYRDVVLAKDSKAAAALVSRNIVEYYAKLRDDALYARVDEIDALPVFGEMQLFVLRQLASRPSPVALWDMTPEQVVALAFEHKLIGTDMHPTAKIEHVKIEGPVATGRLYRNGRDTEKVLRLVLEPEGWRVDLTPFFELTNQQMDELSKAGNREKREYGQRLVETFTGQFLDPALFDPLRARPVARDTR